MDPHATAQSSGGRLKDSCDPCSASKLRCDRQKPVCARCEGLHQSCKYSPARRAGRPHRVRPVSRDCEGTRSSQNSRTTHAPELHFNSQEWQNGFRRNSHRLTSSIDASINTYATEGDCAQNALAVLEQLSPQGIARRPADATLTVTEACLQLFTILVCPCSEKHDVALLVASVCLALMDKAERQSQGSLARDEAATSWCDTSAMILLPSVPDSDKNAEDWAGNPSGGQREDRKRPGTAEDLAKIARVVSQFADKYCQEPTRRTDTYLCTTWLLAPIISLLRQRLQNVTREAARRLAA